MIQKLQSFKARKSLGQNFLFDTNITRKTVDLFGPQADDIVIEIGPGFGALTEMLLPSGCKYTGIEIDERLIVELEKKFKKFKNFSIRHLDFRKLNIEEISKKKGSVRLIGNIPYHITSSIIFTAFEQHFLMKDMMLMMQKEVAERVVAEHGKKDYGILSVISKTYAHPKIVSTVPPSVFIPKPEVDSAIVHWDFSQKQERQPADPDFFRIFVRTIFNQRRKMLRNTLKKLGDVALFNEENEIDLQRRPEALSVIEIIDLSNKFMAFTPEEKSV
ncbi:MAG: ribosomal RNA small subunit methyltransferase A [Calditrichaeota bacterium]|nr:MAG: ribosomal RNA small subunit methyltransferase A [Calditrichota bacterium]